MPHTLFHQAGKVNEDKRRPNNVIFTTNESVANFDPYQKNRRKAIALNNASTKGIMQINVHSVRPGSTSHHFTSFTKKNINTTGRQPL